LLVIQLQLYYDTRIHERKVYTHVFFSGLQIEQLSTSVYGLWEKTKEDSTWQNDQHDLSWAADYNI